MNAVELLNRKDTKFFFASGQLPQILKGLQTNYRILEVNTKRQIGYRNIYFDTPEYHFYLQHHNARLNRYKMRVRQYSDSGLCYFEIKFKTNTERTIKTRIKLPAFTKTITPEIANFITNQTPFSPENLFPVIEISFDRITLVENNLAERATIDTNLTIGFHGIHKTFSKVGIAELKQDRTASGSIFRNVMRNHYGREMRISKYCIGISYLNPAIKQNRFKPRLLAIQKLEKNIN